MKKVVSLTRRAIEQYNMIEDGDKIAVGVSGGKDSLVPCLLYTSTFRRRYWMQYGHNRYGRCKISIRYGAYGR